MNVKEASERLGVTVGRICVMCAAGRLKARKLGRTWAIVAESVEAAKNRKPGRPKKQPEVS